MSTYGVVGIPFPRFSSACSRFMIGTWFPSSKAKKSMTTYNSSADCEQWTGGQWVENSEALVVVTNLPRANYIPTFYDSLSNNHSFVPQDETDNFFWWWTRIWVDFSFIHSLFNTIRRSELKVLEWLTHGEGYYLLNAVLLWGFLYSPPSLSLSSFNDWVCR